MNPADVQDRLQQALGDAYVIERECGGGGMVRPLEVTPDGQRFVGFAREDPLLFTLVLDWAARLPAR